MALLELLAGAAPAGVVAADLLLLGDPARLDVGRLEQLALLAVGGLAERGARGGRGERAGLGAGAAELQVAVAAALLRAERLRGAARVRDLDLDVEDEARELLP